MQESLNQDIIVSGTEEQVEKAKKALELIIKHDASDASMRISIQNTIDLFNITAMVMHKGHRVWSKKRIIANLHKIKAQGPEHLSNYFYEFIRTTCGSALYFNKAAWIRAHPTIDDFGQFFLKNDYKKDTCDYIPDWKSDAKRIVTDIQRNLFPFQSYVKNKNKKF